ncbi:hypothetical protein Bbelb_318430 [Branchiostoma belcheri]|nr:hypothetical protein Bbelb_318430 [Branchiostoma belcheri]
MEANNRAILNAVSTMMDQKLSDQKRSNEESAEAQLSEIKKTISRPSRGKETKSSTSFIYKLQVEEHLGEAKDLARKLFRLRRGQSLEGFVSQTGPSCALLSVVRNQGMQRVVDIPHLLEESLRCSFPSVLEGGESVQKRCLRIIGLSADSLPTLESTRDRATLRTLDNILQDNTSPLWAFITSRQTVTTVSSYSSHIHDETPTQVLGSAWTPQQGDMFHDETCPCPLSSIFVSFWLDAFALLYRNASEAHTATANFSAFTVVTCTVHDHIV